MFIMNSSLLYLLLIYDAVSYVNSAEKLQQQFSWRILDYAYPDENSKLFAKQNGDFIPENNLPVGIEVWNDKLFVTVPRWKPGIPSTLNYIPLHQNTPESPALIPYPSWASNQLGNCDNGLSTVYRIKVDDCDRLWVLDTGTFGIGNTTTNPCPYALNVYDLRTDKRLHRYVFRPEDTNANTFIANIAVELGDTCDDAYAYFSDELGYGLIVYSWRENKSWRFTHGFFYPDPLAGDFNIGGLNFQWFEEGIFGLALTPRQPDGTRILHFSPLASNREFAVSTAILHNSSKVDDSYQDFQSLYDRGPLSHTTSRVIDEASGIELFNLIDRNSIGCWNTGTHPHKENVGVVDRDDIGLSFPCDVKIDRYRNVWVMSDRMPNFLLSSLNYNDVNFRIYFAPIDVLVKGTICEGGIKNNFGLNEYYSLIPSQRLYSPLQDRGFYIKYV